MLSKKTIIVFLVVVGALVSLTAMYFFWPTKDSATDEVVDISTDYPVSATCNPYSNISEAVKTGDSEACNCLAGASRVDLCRATIDNGTFYTKAAETSDPSLCEKITVSGMKTACLSVVKSKLDYIEKNLK